MKFFSRMVGLFLLGNVLIAACGNEDLPVEEAINIELTNKEGVDAFWALYNAHTEALETGKSVKYPGGDIRITIPEDAKSIPLTNKTDFGGTTFTVENKSIDGFFLFTLIGEVKSIDIEQSLLGGRNFSSVPELSKGTVLLLLWDENPWVKNRKGYSYGATRQDNLLLKDGIAQNDPVMPWNNPETTRPRITYVQTDDSSKVIQNVTFNRTHSSTMKTMLVRVEYQNNVLLNNITINTPQNDEMYGDYVVRVYNSTNVIVRDVTINGTYSQNNEFGYGINMLNNWNTSFIRLIANAKWGVFGTSNMNKVSLEDCDINRFDIHCYGRDITMKNCVFRNLYNQFSSVYGTIRYEHCFFYKHTPYLNETSYNCYTPFTLEIEDCVWEVPSQKTPEALCAIGGLFNEYNERPELNKRAYPNVYVDGLKVIVPSKYKAIYVFYHNENITDLRPVENIKEVLVNDLEIEDGVDFNLWNKDINTENTIDFIVKRKMDN